ncbi:MAG: hypothetical protein R3D33_10500 [Hyphomicrobiaceae bacterium]
MARLTRPDPLDKHVHTDEHPAELTGREARQGDRRTTTMYVLTIGTTLAIIAGIAIWLAYWPTP